MTGVNHSSSHSSLRPLGLSPALAGTVCCAVSALGYTGSDVCMRQLSALQCDPTWAICNKELVTVLVIGPWLLVEALRGRRIFPPWRILAMLVLVSLAVQLGGNLGVQWAYGKVGLAITIPAVFGVTLIASAVMGWTMLGERVSLRSAAAIGLLVAAICLLGLGASETSRSIAVSAETAPTALVVALAVGMACMAGGTYALLTIGIRHAVSATTRMSFLVVVVTGTGVVSLGSLSVGRLGIEPLLATRPEYLAWMLAAGTFNLIAFLAITKGLQLTTVVHANVLSASQVAMAAVAGVALFREPPNPWLVLGVTLTSLGIILIDRPIDGEI